MPVSNTDPQGVYSDQGVRTQYGIILPPGARVAAYVRSTGLQSGDDAFLATNLRLTLAAGLALVRPNLGDYVVVLPGHVETVSDATTFSNALIAGTKIIGVGMGGNTPTFTWSVATAQWLVAVNDVMIAGLRLQMAGNATTLFSNTTLPLTVTGNDFRFYYNEAVIGTSANNVAVAMSFTGTAARYDVAGNIYRNPGSSTVTTAILVNSTGADGRITDNEMMTGCTSATGVINITAAAVNLKILRNVINNPTTVSVAGIAYSNVACTGQCAYNTITVLSTGAQTGGVTGITVGGTNNLTGYFQNFVVNDPNKSGILQPAADT